MTIIKDLFRYWFKRNKVQDLYVKNEFKDKTVMTWNIYGVKEIGEGKKLFYRIHYWFKLKLFYPLIIIAKAIYKGKLDTQITDNKYDTNLRIFNDSYDESVDLWYQMFLPHKLGFVLDAKVKPVSARKNDILIILKKLLMKIVYNDNCYREFINIFMHTSARKMFEEYSGKDVKHLFYTDKTIYNVTYYIMSEQVESMDWSKPITLHMNKVGEQK